MHQPLLLRSNSKRLRPAGAGLFFKPTDLEALCDTFQTILRYWQKSQHPKRLKQILLQALPGGFNGWCSLSRRGTAKKRGFCREASF
jgi:hypothetical protein